MFVFLLQYALFCVKVTIVEYLLQKSTSVGKKIFANRLRCCCSVFAERFTQRHSKSENAVEIRRRALPLTKQNGRLHRFCQLR